MSQDSIGWEKGHSYKLKRRKGLVFPAKKLSIKLEGKERETTNIEELARRVYV